MARLEDIEGAKVALDSVIFIYALEGNQEFGDRVLKINDTALRHPNPGLDIWMLADIED